MSTNKLITVEWFKNPKSLSEIYQQTGMCFAFVSSPKDGRKACHEWVKCRDFLHDAVRSQIIKKPCSIYGFTFNHSINPPIDLKKMRMLVSKLDMTNDGIEDFRRKMKCSLILANHFEKLAKTSLTKMEEVDTKGSTKKAVFLFTGPEFWVTSPFMVSMYTFLLRLGYKELKFNTAADLKSELKMLSENKKLQDNDTGYLTASWDKMHKIIEKRAELFPKKDGVHDIYLKDCNINSFHNTAGLFNLSK
jgi:hypothetical protein